MKFLSRALAEAIEVFVVPASAGICIARFRLKPLLRTFAAKIHNLSGRVMYENDLFFSQNENSSSKKSKRNDVFSREKACTTPILQAQVSFTENDQINLDPSCIGL